MRVGIGYDIHRLEEGRRLIMGGIEIPHERGLVGHSDADVVLHAVTDAVLGAAGLSDIGELFPDTDDRFRDADSRELLAAAMEHVREAGFAVNNVDVIIHAERPRMSPYKKPIAASIAALLGVPPEGVNVKAKTNEGMGPLGYADAIACTAAALVVRLP
jgi:2-C-methyl-D-erythritol 2,4-cyclodiphosphate synthase